MAFKLETNNRNDALCRCKRIAYNRFKISKPVDPVPNRCNKLYLGNNILNLVPAGKLPSSKMDWNSANNRRNCDNCALEKKKHDKSLLYEPPRTGRSYW